MVNPENAAPASTPSTARSLPAWIMILAFAVLVGFLAILFWNLNRAQQGAIQIGERVPPFTLTTFDGQVIKSSDLAGKVVVINFWASWCKPCEQEAEEMELVWQMYRDRGDVVFLGVDWVDTEPAARKYLSQFGITYPNGPDLGTTISQYFRIKGVPETYIIGNDGILKNIKIGPYTSIAELQGMIAPLLK